jgi:hypothetical protein
VRYSLAVVVDAGEDGLTKEDILTAGVRVLY